MQDDDDDNGFIDIMEIFRSKSSVLHAALQDGASNGAVLCMERVRCVLEVKPWL